MKLTIVVPMYNEEQFIGTMLETLVLEMSSFESDSSDDSDYEVLVIDDGSSDRSCEIVRNLSNHRIKLWQMPENAGKGAAVRFGISHALGELILVQDADLEYSPSDIPKMLKIYAKEDSKNLAIYGSRILGAKDQLTGWRSTLALWPGQGLPQRGFNLFLSFFHFLLSRKWITDLLTGYKIYPRWIFDNWQSSTSGFETDHEITMRLNQIGVRVLEVPVSYLPRTKDMGKKIKGSDAIKAVTTLWRHR